MPITLLIIDDEMPVSKGYDQIEQAFPGVFKIFPAPRSMRCREVSTSKVATMG
ncbi:MAG: hypothetical protein WC641_07450 [Patescibacteria group bacterium]